MGDHLSETSSDSSRSPSVCHAEDRPLRCQPFSGKKRRNFWFSATGAIYVPNKIIVAKLLIKQAKVAYPYDVAVGKLFPILDNLELVPVGFSMHRKAHLLLPRRERSSVLDESREAPSTRSSAGLVLRGNPGSFPTALSHRNGRGNAPMWRALNFRYFLPSPFRERAG